MDALVFPTSEPPKIDRLNRITAFCQEAACLEEIIVEWLSRGKNRSLTVSRNDEMPFKCVGLSFFENEASIALACLKTSELPKVPALRETVFKFADQEGFIVDAEWFDQRNERMGFYDEGILDAPIADAESLAELVLSYALSNVGLANIKADRMEPDMEAYGQFLRLELVFLGDVWKEDKDSPGFMEKVIIRLNPLRRLLKERRQAQSLTGQGLGQSCR
jgi:hypothetical protein